MGLCQLLVSVYGFPFGSRHILSFEQCPIRDPRDREHFVIIQIFDLEQIVSFNTMNRDFSATPSPYGCSKHRSPHTDRINVVFPTIDEATEFSESSSVSSQFCSPGKLTPVSGSSGMKPKLALQATDRLRLRKKDELDDSNHHSSSLASVKSVSKTDLDESHHERRHL